MSSSAIAIIVGSRSDVLLSQLDVRSELSIKTPFGEPSSKIQRGNFHDSEAMVLYRHGVEHTITPHKINYRANIWALSQLKPKAVIGINTVGGIRSDLKPGDLMLPHQLIDYTWGRAWTFYDDQVAHLEFTAPYSAQVRKYVLQASANCGVSIADRGVYAVTQGPRFETPAEVDRIERDGGDVVGMTGMPEAALAAELDLCYASINLVVNPAAGRSPARINFEEIKNAQKKGCEDLNVLLKEALRIMQSIQEIVPETEVFR